MLMRDPQALYAKRQLTLRKRGSQAIPLHLQKVLKSARFELARGNPMRMLTQLQKLKLNSRRSIA